MVGCTTTATQLLQPVNLNFTHDGNFTDINVSNDAYVGNKLGIGIGSPLRRLDMLGSVILTDGTTNAWLIHRSGADYELWFQSSYAAGDNGWTQRVELKGSSGNFGLGTSSPDQRLKVVGNINVTGDINYGGSLNSYSPLMLGVDHDRGYTTQCWVDANGGQTLIWFQDGELRTEPNSDYCEEQKVKKDYYQTVINDEYVDEQNNTRFLTPDDLEKTGDDWRVKQEFNKKIVRGVDDGK